MFPSSSDTTTPQTAPAAPSTPDALPPVPAGDDAQDGAPTSLSLPADQLVILCGPDCVPGTDYTVQIHVNEPGQDGLTPVDVISSEAKADNAANPDAAADSSAPEGQNTDDEDATDKKVLGYARSKFKPKKEIPSLSAKDLEY